MSDGTPVLIAGIKARLSKTDEEIDKELSVGELVMYDQCVALYTPGVCTCAGGDEASGYMHEALCGLEYVVDIHDVIRGASALETRILIERIEELQAKLAGF